MKALLRAGIWLLIWLGWLAGTGLAEVVVIPIKGQITDAQYFFLRRALREADHSSTKAVVIDMDTFGGSQATTLSMQKALDRVKTRTITYINPNAGSAGALIAVSTKAIYMSPIAAIGAAAPVTSGGDLPETMKEKNVSFTGAFFRSTAEANGHNPDIAEAFINNEKEVVIGTETVHRKGKVLTLSAQEAARKIEGKPVLAAGIAKTIEEVLAQEGLSGPIRRVEPSAAEHVAFWITELAPIFLTVGLLGIWLEVKTPGFGLPGIAAAISLTIFFTGHYLAGLSGLEAAALFILGLILVLTELLFFPGILILAGVGVLLMLGSLLWAMVDFIPGGGGWWPTADAMTTPLINFGLAILIAMAAAALLARYLPRTRLYKSIVLGAQIQGGPAFVPKHNEFSGLAPGAEGVALSILRPSGRAEFEGVPRDVISTGIFVEAGTPIRVIAVEGARIVVQPIES